MFVGSRRWLQLPARSGTDVARCPHGAIVREQEIRDAIPIGPPMVGAPYRPGWSGYGALLPEWSCLNKPA
jgi:hypothetical protein